MSKVNITEDLDHYGNYILRAGGRVFYSFPEVYDAFPGDEFLFVPKPPPRATSSRMARDVDFPLFGGDDDR